MLVTRSVVNGGGARYLSTMTAPTPLSRDAMLAALAWQVELGADEAIGDGFIDRTTLPPPETKPAVPVKAAASATDTAAAAEVAAGCADLDALKAAMAAFPHPLKESAKNCVFADGNPAARVMIVGEAPGRDEDIQGLPFVGRSGQLLDKMLACIGLDRHAEEPAEAVYIANILPWRPVANRTPSVEESHAFMPFLDRHVALADPQVIVTMGNVSTKTLLATTTGIMRLRGHWTVSEFGGKTRPLLPMLHPAYLLRQPGDKGKAWADLLSLQAKLEGLA